MNFAFSIKKKLKKELIRGISESAYPVSAITFIVFNTYLELPVVLVTTYAAEIKLG